MLLKASELVQKKILIFGLNGTGKTHLAKYLSRFFKSGVITLNSYEWKEEDVLIFESPNIETYEFWLNQITQNSELRKNINCVIIDDFDVFFTSHLQNLKAFSDLVFRNRHLGLTVIAITRRPQNIPTKYYEIFEILVGFTIEATNVINKLNEIYQGLGDMVKNLPYKSYKFVWKEIGKPPVILNV